jgi:dTMP kinase
MKSRDKPKKNKRGKIIVIDGIDGAGKRTQSKLLLEKLKKMNKKVVRLDFPAYNRNFIGKNILDFLNNSKFNFLRLDPKIASIVYAADRWESKELILNYLSRGFVVILDRYVTSNQIHQGGKYTDGDERERMCKWIEELEYKVFKIPKPDKILLLNLSLETSLQLTKERRGRDLAEEDVQYQKNSGEMVNWLLANNKKILNLECEDGCGTVKSKQEIAEMVFEKVKKII